MNRYLHITLCTLAIFAMASCVVDRIDMVPNDGSGDDNSMTFRTKVENTRAAVTDDAKLKSYGKFNVATFLADAENTPYYSDQVSYASSVWSSSAKRYWPTGYKLNLFAYSPVSGPFTIVDSDSYSDFSMVYSCPADIDQQIDMLVETIKDQSPDDDTDGAAGQTIALDFKHALSGIKFSVEFETENNVTLDSLTLHYVGMERERAYNFSTASWGPLQGKYFDKDSGASTILKVGKTQIATGPVKFENIDKCLMIIPQPLRSGALDTHHSFISVKVSYTLNGALGGTKTAVSTGVMPLPPPQGGSRGEYKQGELYTYNIKVNGERITFVGVGILDQDVPVAANGNIDLGLITTFTDPNTIPGYVIPSGVDGAEDAQYYYTTALRVKKLLEDGVRDFVLYGDLGAVGVNFLGNGKIGYYGDKASSFNIGESLAQAAYPSKGFSFSVDLRGTYGYPEFQYADQTESMTTDLAPQDKIMMPGLFSKVTGLKEVMMPHGMMAIGTHAFEGCTALTTIDLAEVKHIESGGFQNSTSLVTVKGDNLTRVHNNSFKDCGSLQFIDLSGVSNIGASAFVNCVSLGDVDLSSLDIIGKNAFENCRSLSLVDHTSFTRVADYAFNGCVKLGANDKRVDLTHATYVGDHAFAECDELKVSDGDLPNLKEIGDYAFAHCTHVGSMYDLYLTGIEKIGISAFEGCSSVNVFSGLERLDSISMRAFKDCPEFTGFDPGVSSTLALPKVQKVDGYGFNNSGVTSVDFSNGIAPSKLTSIGEHAFEGCEHLTMISGLDQVTSVGNYGFSACTALKELNLPNLVDDGCGGNFISGCSSLERLSLRLVKKNGISWREVVTDAEGHVIRTSWPYVRITDMLVSAKATLEYLYMPALEEEIPDWAFQGFSLVEVNLSSVKELGAGALQNCKELTSVDLSSVHTVGHYALQGCEKLLELRLPELTDAGCGGDFFSYCSSLEVLSLPLITDNDLSWTDDDGYHGSTVMGMVGNSLKEIYLPLLQVDVVSGWGGVFDKNRNIRIVDLSSALSVGNGGFFGSSIESIDLSSVTKIGGQAFDSCKSLKRINLSGIKDNPDSDGDGVYDNVPNSAFWSASTATCEVWLSQEQFDTVTGGNNWIGHQWGAIHNADNPSAEPFVL